MEKIRIGISQCLLGERVRHDGGHKKDPYITMTLGRFFEWVPVCPELEAGLGVPRESVHLVSMPTGIRMLGVRSRNDVTKQVTLFSAHKIDELKTKTLHGYIFKKDSPSCGVERVRIYTENNLLHRNGRGLFADAFMKAFPLVPVEEEGRLHDLPLRENFIERVYCYHRWTSLISVNPGGRDLVDFHTRHKMTVLAHNPTLYRELGRVVAECGKRISKSLLDQYGELFMQALKTRSTPRKHANVLYHLAGYLKKSIDAADRAELVSCIEQYRTEQVPLIVPITLLKHHFSKHPVQWINEQVYLNPYPSELMLRNHV